VEGRGIPCKCSPEEITMKDGIKFTLGFVRREDIPKGRDAVSKGDSRVRSTYDKLRLCVLVRPKRTQKDLTVACRKPGWTGCTSGHGRLDPGNVWSETRQLF
jgi:hypothetical protein